MRLRVDPELRQLTLEEWRADQREMAKWQSQKRICLERVNDPRIRTLLGRMYVLQQPVAIDGQMLAAGMRAAEVLRHYDFHVLNVYRGVRAQDLARERGRLAKEERTDLVRRAKDAYRELLIVLGAARMRQFDGYAGAVHFDKPGRLALSTFAVCREEQREVAPLRYEIELTVKGLGKLAEHWGLYAKDSTPIRSWQDAETIAARAARVLMPQSGNP